MVWQCVGTRPSIAIPFVLHFINCYLAIFYCSYYKNQYLLSILHWYHHLFTELVHLYTIVLGVLGTQETLRYLVAGLLERDHLHPTPPTD